MLFLLAPLLGLVALSGLSVYLQPRFIIALLSRAYPEVVFTVSTKEKIIALTIDDAPTSKDTPQILDILKQYDVKATFFCIGHNIVHADPSRDILARMHHEGHELGNHMMLDAPSYQLSEEEFTKQLLEVDCLLEEITHGSNGGTPSEIPLNNTASKWFRPGHGFFTRKMVDTALKHGYKTALGDCYPHDPAIALSSVNSFCIFTHTF